MGQSKYSFSKHEKLTGKKKIEELFKDGSSFYLSAFQIKYHLGAEEVHQVLIAVPKKLFKRAVDRNLIRRRIREAYRLNKQILYSDNQSEFYSIGFVYLSKEILSFHEIQDQLIKCLERLIETVEKKK